MIIFLKTKINIFIKLPELVLNCQDIIRTYLKNNLSAHGGVAKRFKMLTYYVYAPLFHRFAT